MKRTVSGEKRRNGDLSSIAMRESGIAPGVTKRVGSSSESVVEARVSAF